MSVELSSIDRALAPRALDVLVDHPVADVVIDRRPDAIDIGDELGECVSAVE